MNNFEKINELLSRTSLFESREDVSGKFKLTIEKILDGVEKWYSNKNKGNYSYWFPKSEYFDIYTVKEISKYLESKGYNVEIHTYERNKPLEITLTKKKLNESELNEGFTKSDVKEFKEGLVEEFKKKYKGLLDFEHDKDAMKFSIESAFYWYGNDYHAGQNDIWYSILSTSDYKPGRSMSDIKDTEDSDAEMFYEFLENKFQKKNLKESEENSEKLSFKDPIEVFEKVLKESQGIYVKKNDDGTYTGSYDTKKGVGWVAIDGYTASAVMKVYKACRPETQEKLRAYKSITNLVDNVWKVLKK